MWLYGLLLEPLSLVSVSLTATWGLWQIKEGNQSVSFRMKNGGSRQEDTDWITRSDFLKLNTAPNRLWEDLMMP